MAARAATPATASAPASAPASASAPTGGAWLQRIGTATPRHEVHAAFRDYARARLDSPRERRLFDALAERSGIASRYAVLAPGRLEAGEIDAAGFYRRGAFPGTAERMALFAREALPLALNAVHALAPPDELAARLARVTHLVVVSCTGLEAPGLDVQLVESLGLGRDVQRTVIGFMGCAAALPALRLAAHTVRAEHAADTPREACVLVVNVELSSLHLQDSRALEPLLSFLLFGDAASAALVGGAPAGPDALELLDFRSRLLPASQGHITWRIGDGGFEMHLSGQVPVVLARTLAAERTRRDAGSLLRGRDAGGFALWAVHAGGRTVLDAVEAGLRLPPEALADSRAVLAAVGNVSSVTVMFVLRRLMQRLAHLRSGARPADRALDGLALAFGPGMSCESMAFRAAPAA